MKNLSLIIASLLTIGGVTAAEVYHSDYSIFSSNGDGFKNVITENAQDIDNAINNTLAGREDPETVKKLILTEYRGTFRDSTYSNEEIEINTKYQQFLIEAYNVMQVYETGQAPDLTAMNDAKLELY